MTLKICAKIKALKRKLLIAKTQRVTALTIKNKIKKLRICYHSSLKRKGNLLKGGMNCNHAL
jgi:hypothetical protein